MAKPKTAKLRLEITNDDGSKSIITTTELDASKVREFACADDPDHIAVGVVDPFYDEFRRDGEMYLDSFTRFRMPRETHFSLDLQLQPVDPHPPFYYQIETVPTNATEVVMALKTDGSVEVLKFTEREAASFVDLYDDVHFFLLNIP